MNRIFKIISAILGCLWLGVYAAAGVSIFMDMDGWERKVLAGNVQILNKYNGGEVAFELPEKDYLVLVHEPVGDRLFKKASKTNIQVDWLASDKLPDRIAGDLDIDRDGKTDISVDIDTRNEEVQYKIWNDAITGLLDKGSLAEIGQRAAESGRTPLFFYKDMKYGTIVYKECMSIRIIME